MLKCDLVMFYICYKKYIHKIVLWLAGWLYAVYTVVGLSPSTSREVHLSVRVAIQPYTVSSIQDSKGSLGQNLFFFYIYNNWFTLKGLEIVKRPGSQWFKITKITLTMSTKLFGAGDTFVSTQRTNVWLSSSLIDSPFRLFFRSWIT